MIKEQVSGIVHMLSAFSFDPSLREQGWIMNCIVEDLAQLFYCRDGTNLAALCLDMAARILDTCRVDINSADFMRETAAHWILHSCLSSIGLKLAGDSCLTMANIGTPSMEAGLHSVLSCRTRCL